MNEVLKLYKTAGETPLECIERFRALNKAFLDVPMTYAGRLDPLAEGLLLVLTGDLVKDKAKYLNLDKIYEFEVLFGFSTDTGDVLGKVTDCKLKNLNSDLISIILEGLKGKKTQAYPAYSSKTVEGKPLWSLSRDGEVNDIEIPTKEIEIYKLEFLGERQITETELQAEIYKKISRVLGDFRQAEIIEKWKEVFQKIGESNFKIFKFRAECSSGTYMRVLAENIGKELGMPALAYSIKRIRVGEFSIDS